MSVAPTQCNLLALTMRKSDLEYRLLQITGTVSRMAAQTAALNQEVLTKVQSMNKYQTVLTGEGSKDVAERLAAFYSSEFYTAYQTQMALINTKEKALNVEKQQIETQINAINTMIEGVEKQIDNNLKQNKYGG